MQLEAAAVAVTVWDCTSIVQVRVVAEGGRTLLRV